MLYYIIVMFITIIDNIVVNPMIFDVNVSSNHERLKSLQSNSVANSNSYYIFTTTYTTPQLSSKKKIKRKLERNPRLIKSRETLKSISKSSDTFLTPANINVLNLPADKYTRTNRYRRSISTIPLYKSMEEISQMAKFTTIGQIRQYLLKEANIVQINPLQFDVKKFRDELTTYHNVYRSKHGSPPVVHDPVLENAAQNWANVLGNKKDCLVHEDPRRYGENLFFFGAKTFPTPTTMALSVTQSFYMESVGYNYNTFYPMTYYKTGHFTQLIWKESQRIGIGVAIVHDDGRGNGLCQSTKPLYLIYIVVKYDPAGNFQSEQAYLNNVKSPVM